MISILIPLLVASPTSAQAQDLLPTGDEVLATTAQAHKRLKRFSVNYVYTVTDLNLGPMAKDQVSGTAWVSGDRYRVSYPETELVGDGSYVWVQHHNVRRVFVYDEDPTDYFDVERLFQYDWTSGVVESVTPDSGSWRVSMRIDDPEVFRAEIWVRKNDGLIDQAILYDLEGRRHSYEMGAYETGKRIPARTFRFDTWRNPEYELLALTEEPIGSDLPE